MRLSIILAICFIGVCVSASGLRTRRGFFDDLKNKTKNAFEGFKNLFGHHDKNDTVEIKVAPVEEKTSDDRVKRFLDPFEVLRLLADPEAFTADFLRILKNKLTEPREKRAVNPLDLLNSINDPNKFALNVFSLVGDMVNQQTGGKLGSNPLQLLADLQNPQKAFKTIFKIVSDMAQERPKRDIASNMQEQAQKLYDNIKAAIEKMFKKPAQEVAA